MPIQPAPTALVTLHIVQTIMPPPCWSPAQRSNLVSRAHLLGHFQTDTTVARLRSDFKVYWPSMAADVAKCVASCAVCLQYRPSPPPEHPARALQIPALFHRVAMDLVLGMPVTPEGFIGVLVISIPDEIPRGVSHSQ